MAARNAKPPPPPDASHIIPVPLWCRDFSGRDALDESDILEPEELRRFALWQPEEARWCRSLPQDECNQHYMTAPGTSDAKGRIPCVWRPLWSRCVAAEDCFASRRAAQAHLAAMPAVLIGEEYTCYAIRYPDVLRSLCKGDLQAHSLYHLQAPSRPPLGHPSAPSGLDQRCPSLAPDLRLAGCPQPLGEPRQGGRAHQGVRVAAGTPAAAIGAAIAADAAAALLRAPAAASATVAAARAARVAVTSIRATTAAAAATVVL